MKLDERRNFIPLCLWRVSVDHVDSSTLSERTPCPYHLISRFFTLNLCKNAHPISSSDSQRISCSYICLYSCITLFYECAGTQLLTNLRIATVYHRIETACYIELPSQFQCGKKICFICNYDIMLFCECVGIQLLTKLNSLQFDTTVIYLSTLFWVVTPRRVGS